jgi:amino acid transporter
VVRFANVALMTDKPQGTSANHGSDPAETGSAMSLAAVISVGVGGMVGGGIFAVLGLSVELAGGAAPVAFAIAGAIAVLTAMSYSKLSTALPSSGGTVTYLNCAFGTGIVAGGLNVLLWMSYVVMLALYASAFGSYFLALFPSVSGPELPTAGVILLFTGLNALSAGAVGRAEEVIVGIKVMILVGFVVIALPTVETARLATDTWASPLGIVGGGMVIFLAYEGFELIANTAEDVVNPKRNLPRAFLISVVGVIALYIAIAVVTVGTLDPSAISAASDFALAAAARPILGQTGFTIIAIAALLSTSSAINATLYGAARLTYGIARSGELPKILENKVRGQPIEGLLVTAALTLVVALGLDLSRIATIGSAGFLVIFAAVNIANLRLRAMTKTSRWLPIVAATACLGALAALLTEIGARDRGAVFIVAGLGAGSFILEAAYRKSTGRTIKSLLPLENHHPG